MNKTQTMGYNSLSQKELGQLEKYLEKYSKAFFDDDYRIDSISALDGYLTALLSAPKNYPAHFWLQPLFDFSKAKMKTVEKVLDLLFRHYNSIVYALNIDPENVPFEPYFDFIDSPNGEIVITDFWCMGYLRFIELTGFEMDGAETEPHLLKVLNGAAFMLNYAQEQANSDEPLSSLSEELCIENADEVIEAVLQLHYLGRKAYLDELQNQLEQENNATLH